MSADLQLLGLRFAARARTTACARALLAAHRGGAACPIAAVAAAYPAADSSAAAAERTLAALNLCQIAICAVWQLPAPWMWLPEPPVALFVRGETRLLGRRPSIAIVGARRCSPGGLAWARAAACLYAQEGWLVVSGGAYGVDSAAHDGALAGGGPTLAIVGSAIDRLYPAGNLPLYRRLLLKGGAIASEHAPLEETFKSAHARRNRLIVGCADALLVVEAASNSGTMSAARFARQAKCPIYVAPATTGGERAGIDWLLARGQAQLHPALPRLLPAPGARPP